ncbi:MAG: hypothetical protein H0T44_08220 [Gemmatimonadales bacterium]|nr:hypothetical protein [Gemmatimonadales bacterium]MDQ3427821.1 hypothetical protein [Gemmatimonadota bacterium]
MIVYRDQRREADPALLLDELSERVCRLSLRPDHDGVVSVLVELGVVETAVADALSVEADGWTPLQRTLRRATQAAGHLLWHSWHESRGLEEWRARLQGLLGAARGAELPAMVELRTPEGFAHYGVYPETYLEAGVRCARELQPARAVCLGIRSIGTSLSGAVVAALEKSGCMVESYTIRPRGHPFNRHVVLTAELESALRAAAPWSHFVLVDEGPGISGSSLAGAADALGRLGVADERIVLMPSWRTDGTGLNSDSAQDRCRRHRQFTASFDEVWLDSGRLGAAAPGPGVRDLSAGAWRELLIPGDIERPAVQPHHERRKLLAAGRLYSFVGLGRYGEPKFERTRELAEAGFTPAPLALEHGFLVRDFVAGQPVGPAERDIGLVKKMARYLAHLRTHYRREPAAAPNLQEMMEVNTGEALGTSGMRALATRLRSSTQAIEAPVALDGRMLPHEWLRTSQGYLKVDVADHHDDHFLPGCQDIAWDVAGTCVEFDLRGDERRGFVERYRRAAGDWSIGPRLRFHAVAYLCFRVGYASLAAKVLGDSPDGRRFRLLQSRYADALREELSMSGESRWDV